MIGGQFAGTHEIVFVAPADVWVRLKMNQLMEDYSMKTLAALAAAAFVLSVGGASACEWNKTAAQSTQAPDNTKVASIAGPQSAPVKK